MNFGMVLLAMFLVGASIFGIFAIAAQNQTPYTDTFGNTTSNTTNETRSTIDNSTAAFSGASGGLAIILAVFVIFVAVIFTIRAAYGNTSYNTRR